MTVLDHIIAHRNVTWLGAEHDKVAHFLTTTSLRREELPRLMFGARSRRHRAVPSGQIADRRVARRALARALVPPRQSRSETTSGSSFVVMQNSSVRCPPGRSGCSSRPAWNARSSTPTRRCSARNWRHRSTRRWQTSSGGSIRAPTSPTPSTRTRLRRARRAFGAPRFRAIRKAWLQDGDRVVDVAMSTSLADAIARESGRFERHALSRQYFHLSSMVGSA